MSKISYENWEPVIGLEIHAQLLTRTKMFSRAPNRFGDEPNTNISYTDTAQPGSLPVLNKEAVYKAVMFAIAIGSEIAPVSRFDRKSYFYPDSPRNYQITQYFFPFMHGGKIIAEVDGQPKEFQVHHAHLEDDAGILKHFNNFAGIDYNRAGVPLIEIVSDPCMHSPKEASAYAMAVKAILEYLDVSDCNMEEGSLRIDTNISVRPKGSHELRTKVEIKNINSFSHMEMAIETEIRRQIIAYSLAGENNPTDVIQSSTYRFDLATKENLLMRTKEQAEDYRYFPEPDLPPLVITQEFIHSIRMNLPELPHARFCRYREKLGLSHQSASVLINDKKLADYFEQGCNKCLNPKALCNWITSEFVGRFKDKDQQLHRSAILPDHIASLVNMIDKGQITGKMAKTVADLMVSSPGLTPESIVLDNPDFRPMSREEVSNIIDLILKQNPKSVEDFQNGLEKAYHSLVGQIMKETKDKAPPTMVKEILLKTLKS